MGPVQTEILRSGIVVTASLAVGGVLWLTLTAMTGDHAQPTSPRVSVDRLRMVEGCVYDQPVYQAPDRKLWIWDGDWVRVDTALRLPCVGG